MANPKSKNDIIRAVKAFAANEISLDDLLLSVGVDKNETPAA